MRVLGIDVSHWEGVIDWNKAAPGLGFVYYKCTEGTSFIDDKFLPNHNGAIANHVPSAPYHYYRPNQSGLAQANHFVKTSGLNYRKYVIDVEANPNPPMSQAANWSNLKVLLDRVEVLTGTIPAIYSGYYTWLEQMGNKPAAVKYDFMLARYSYAKNPLTPYPWVKPKVWQFTDYGFWEGCLTEVDMDWFYGTRGECSSYFGVKNYVQV